MNIRLSKDKEDDIFHDADNINTEDIENNLDVPIPTDTSPVKEISNKNDTSFIVKIVENLVNAVQEKDKVQKVVFKRKEKMYPCNICGKLFAQYATSKKHCLMNKAADLGVMCTICGKTLRRKRNLKRHIAKIHDPNRIVKPVINTLSVPIKCTDCGKEYSARNKLAEHMRNKHGLSRNAGPLFNCTECEFTHYSESRVKAHITVNHLAMKNNSFNCSVCKISYQSASGLQKHNRMVHSKVTSTATALSSEPAAYIVAKKSQPPLSDNTQSQGSSNMNAMFGTSSQKVGVMSWDTSNINTNLDNPFPSSSESNDTQIKTSTRGFEPDADLVLQDIEGQICSGSIFTESELSFLQL